MAASLAMAPLAAEPTEEGTLEQRGVEPVGLGTAMLARDGNTRSMDDVRLYALRDEPACQPEAVVAGLEGYRLIVPFRGPKPSPSGEGQGR